jgi:hypothetical protein
MKRDSRSRRVRRNLARLARTVRTGFGTWADLPPANHVRVLVVEGKAPQFEAGWAGAHPLPRHAKECGEEHDPCWRQRAGCHEGGRLEDAVYAGPLSYRESDRPGRGSAEEWIRPGRITAHLLHTRPPSRRGLHSKLINKAGPLDVPGESPIGLSSRRGAATFVGWHSAPNGPTRSPIVRSKGGRDFGLDGGRWLEYALNSLDEAVR